MSLATVFRCKSNSQLELSMFTLFHAAEFPQTISIPHKASVHALRDHLFVVTVCCHCLSSWLQEFSQETCRSILVATILHTTQCTDSYTARVTNTQRYVDFATSHTGWKYHIFGRNLSLLPGPDLRSAVAICMLTDWKSYSMCSVGSLVREKGEVSD